MAQPELTAELLDHCLSQIQGGGLTLEQCLGQHPQLAEQLRPLLHQAQAARQLLASSGPTEEFRMRSQARLLSRIQQRQPAANRSQASGVTAEAPAQHAPAGRSMLDRARELLSRRGPSLPGLKLRPAYALMALLLAVALLGSSVGVAYAANQSLPGDSLYGIKRGMERAALAISRTDEGDAQLLLKFAGRRLDEAQKLAQTGRQQDIPGVLSDYEATVDQALELTGSNADGLAVADSALAQHELRLAAVLESAPLQAAPALEAALEHAQHGHQVIEQLRAGGQPNELAPGQQKKEDDGQSSEGDLPPGQLNSACDPAQTTPPGQLKNKDNRGGGNSNNQPPGQLKRQDCPTEIPTTDPNQSPEG